MRFPYSSLDPLVESYRMVFLALDWQTKLEYNETTGFFLNCSVRICSSIQNGAKKRHLVTLFCHQIQKCNQLAIRHSIIIQKAFTLWTWTPP